MNFNVKIILLIALIFAVISVAEIPRTMNYQGKLTDASGIAVHSPAGIAITFRIFDVSTGGSALWTEAHASVPVNNGLFDVILGETTALNLPFDNQYWIELQVAGETLVPREGLTAVGYAHRTVYADTAEFVASGGTNWTLSGTDIYNNNSGNVGIGTVGPETPLDVYRSDASNSFIQARSDVGRLRFHVGPNRNWIQSSAAGASTGRDLYFSDIGGSNVRMAIIASSGNVGIGTDSPTQKLDVDGQIRIRGGSIPAVGDVLTATSTDGTADWQTPAGGDDGDWELDVDGYVLYSGGDWGLSRFGNTLLTSGTSDLSAIKTHVNWGVNSTTGISSGFDTYYATVGGGYVNNAYGYGSTISGGSNNEAGTYSVVGGGSNNNAGNWLGFVGGGEDNSATGQYAVVPGGYGNTAQSYGEVVVGLFATVGSGSWNSWIGTDRLFVVGNGTGTGSRSDAMTILKNGNTGIGTTSPASKLSVGGDGISDCAIYGEGTSYGVYGSVSGGSGINTGVYGVASGDGVNLGGSFSSESELGSVFGIRAKADYTGSGTEEKVIGVDIRTSSTTSPQYGLYVDSRHTGTTGSNHGIYSHATLPVGNTDTLCGVSSSAFRYGVDGVTYGVYAQADSGTNVYGVYAEGEGGSDTTCGVYGVASGDGVNYGGSFSSESELGSVFGIRAKADYTGSGTGEKAIGADIRSSSTTSPQYGLYVESKHTGTTGFNQGIFSSATLPLGNRDGLCGITSSASRGGDDGPTRGVYVHADRGTDVYGVYAEVVPGPASVTTCGVYGHVLGGSPGTNIGVYGSSLSGEGTNIGVWGEVPDDSPTNWAGFFAGNVHVTNSVGIGTTSPSFDLQLSENSAAKPSTNTWTVASDKRLKEDISPYSEGLESILRINPIWFTYNGKAGMPRDTGVGVIAQDLQEIAPYMVNTWIYDDGNGNQTEYLGVDNGAMTYMLINAVKEQQAQIEALEAENAELRSEIERLKALEARIEALENK